MMAIYDFMSKKPVDGVLTKGARGQMFKLIIKRLSATELQDVRDALDEKINGAEIHTAGWMPGRDWTGTAFQPLYDKAAQRDYATSALMFGLMVWEAFERHPEVWYTGRFEKDGVDIGSRTYFKPIP